MRVTIAPAVLAACLALGALSGCKELPLLEPVITRYALTAVNGAPLPARSQAAPLDTTWTLGGEVTIVGTRAADSLHTRDWNPWAGWHETSFSADYAFYADGDSIWLSVPACRDICDPGWTGRMVGDSLVLTRNERDTGLPVYAYRRTSLPAF